MQGVSLEDGVFDEPPPKERRGKGHKLPQLATGSAVEERKKHLVHQRRERFRQVTEALDVLISWAKCEQKCFEAKVLKLGPTSQTGRKHCLKKQQRDIERAENCVQATREAESTDEDAGDMIRVMASGIPEGAGLGHSTFYLTSEEQYAAHSVKAEQQEAIDLEAEFVAFFRIAAPSDTAQKVYKSVVTDTDHDHAADTALGTLEEESGEDTADDQPGSSGLPQSRPVAGNVCPGRKPAAGGMDERAKDWVIVKTPGCRQAQIMERSLWKQGKMGCMLGLLLVRERALYTYGQAFGGDVLLDDADTISDEIIGALSAIHKDFDGKLWGLRDTDVAPCVKYIPQEILESCSRAEFIEQYRRLRKWLQALKTSAFVREFYILESCLLRKTSGDDEQGRPLAATNASCFWASRQDIVEATDDNFFPRIGNRVHSKTHGKCKVEKIKSQASSTKLLRYIMTTPYSEISKLQIYHVVRAYQRGTLLALPSESLAESVASVLTDAAQKATGKPKEVEAFIQATVVRLAGLRGHGGEDGILADALNTHFEGFGTGPEAWKFQKSSPASGGKVSVVHDRIALNQKIRLQHCQPWVEAPFADVARHIRPCKLLPGPGHFFPVVSLASVKAKKDKQNVSATGDKQQAARKRQREGDTQAPAQARRRQSVQSWRSEHKPSVLPAALWRCMNAHTMSIGADLRPGEHFR